MKKIFSYLVLISFFPLVASASGGATDFRSLMRIFLNMLGMFMNVLYAAAFAAFFWGVVQYIWNTDDAKSRQAGNSWMTWSVVALFVMVTLWGIIGMLVRTFGMTPSVIPQLGAGA